jgi:hypothetical protein
MTYQINAELTVRGLRARVDRAEADLLKARLALEELYVGEKLPTAHMYAGSLFVRRSTADRWRAEAFAAAKKAYERDPNPAPDDSPPADDEGDDAPHDAPEDQDDAEKRRRKKAKEAKEREGCDDKDVEEAEARAYIATNGRIGSYLSAVKYSAKAILAAGAKYRAGTVGTELPPKGTLARMVIDAGKKRRGEPVEDE